MASPIAMAANPELRPAVERGLRMKKIGNYLLALIGGREVHPVSACVGGFYRAPKHRELLGLKDELEWGLEAAMETVKDRFGFSMRGDDSAVSATYGLGADTPATPDGRRDGDPFADSTLAPMPGMDRKGPTAVLNSCAKIDTLKTYNHLLNQKFQPQFLEDDLKPVFIDYIRTWKEKGIPHIQFNVVDKETLVEAQKRPEEFEDLIVRVAGFSAYFVDLSRGLQDHIIARTEQSLR